MPELSRRHYSERPDCWQVYYGDVQVGTIARRVGCPVDVDHWEWRRSFYPGMHPYAEQLRGELTRRRLSHAPIRPCSDRAEPLQAAHARGA